MKRHYIAAMLALGTTALLAAEGVDGAFVNPKCKAMVKPAASSQAPIAKAIQGKNKKMMNKKKGTSPFLIAHGLPHLTKLVKMHWNDPMLKLNDEQKAKLLEIRKETLGTIKSLKPQIMRLQRDIVRKSKAGEKAETLKPMVEKLAKLKAEATMAHLTCLDKTKAVLNKDQLFYLMSSMKKHRGAGKGKGMIPLGKPASMKCAAGKCGSAR
jgi:hypothetical protein